MFGESSFEEDDYRRPITELPVRFCGLDIPNPTKSSATNYEVSTLVCPHLRARIIKTKSRAQCPCVALMSAPLNLKH